MYCPACGTVSIENVNMGDPAYNAVHMLSRALQLEGT